MIRNLLGILRHPLNRGRPMAALWRVAAWQIGTRLLPGDVVVPFAGSAHLVVRRGMTGATGNVYCGLHEFEDMGFVLHVLRSSDLFVDVGANIGSYTVLAAGVTGARCVSVEPVPGTFESLLRNIRYNGLEARVVAHNVALGAEPGEVDFTAGLDTTNHAATADDRGLATTRVRVETLDRLLADSPVPTVIKIDVEGFETRVIEGADTALRNPGLLAVLMEINGSGAHYGFDEANLRQRMHGFGFVEARYEPFARSLLPASSVSQSAGNVIFVRDIDALRERLLGGMRVEINGQPV